MKLIEKINNIIYKKNEEDESPINRNDTYFPSQYIGREPTEKEMRRAQRARDKKVTEILFTYDREHNEYIWEEWDDVHFRDVLKSSVHITGKKNHYFWTDIWGELTWAKKGQSAIHMYLWTITNKLNPDDINQKSKTNDVDMKKIIIYGAIGVVVVIIAWGFIPH